MLTTIAQALYFFLPAYAANAAPVIFAKFGWWNRLAVPVDMNIKMSGRALCGATKTWRGILAGILFAVITALIQYLIHESAGWREYLYLFRYTFHTSVFLGVLMGLGEGFGDLAKSFVKRRLALKSGASCFPLDQSSFLLALLFSLAVYTPSPPHLLAIVLISPLIPVIANIVAFKMKLKKVWW